MTGVQFEHSVTFLILQGLLVLQLKILYHSNVSALQDDFTYRDEREPSTTVRPIPPQIPTTHLPTNMLSYSSSIVSPLYQP